MIESLSVCLTSLGSDQLLSWGECLSAVKDTEPPCSHCQVITLNRFALLHNGSREFQFHTHIRSYVLVVEMCLR